MRKILQNGVHSEKELIGSLVVFFRSKKMRAEVINIAEGHYVINAISDNLDSTDKIFGEEMKCHVEIRNLGDGEVAVEAGKGSWSGKVIAASVAVGTSLMLPVCWPTVFLIGSYGVSAIKNTCKQAMLPKDVCDFAEAFLA